MNAATPTETVIALSASIRPMLAGRGPEIQSAVLCELTSVWLAGLPKAAREELFAVWIETVREILPSTIDEIFRCKPPAGWEP